MSRTPYPCWGLTFSDPVTNADQLVTSFLEWRNDERWLLLGGPAVVSETQLWTAWLGLASRHTNSTMRANTLDSEYIRLIAGTHQIRIGFERAGLADGDQTAWLIHLPEFQTNPINETEWPELDRTALDLEADRLMCILDAKLLPHAPIPHEESVNRLELQVEDEESLDMNAIHRSALAHIALADFN
jgi:tRNA threonylcarbamoyladenosine modification (KEOPS) complex Cgi121 subunit